VSTTAYLQAARQILNHLEKTQAANLGAAADLIVNALRNGGTVNCSEIGHGIQWDFINRAGGLLAVQAFSYNLTINNPIPECRRKQPAGKPDDRDLEPVRYAVNHSNLRPGDVMLLASVSGRNRQPVELALACRDRGVRTIGFTAMAYTQKVTSAHPSGKRLFEVVDVAVDNGAPYGDAGVEVPGYEVKLIPLSGLGMIAAGWMIWEQVMTKMAAAGTPASVFISQNREDGPAYNDKMKAQYQQRGF